MKTSALRPLFLVALAFNTTAAEMEPPASPEVTAAMQPYLGSYKLAGVIGLIADKSGKVHYKNLLGYLSHAAMDELRKEQTGATKVNYSLGYHLRDGLFGRDGAYGTDLSVNPTNGMVTVFMVQCPGPDQRTARDLFLKTATQVFRRDAR